jgi:hypothetical protein
MTTIQFRLARWSLFEPKIPVLVNFGGSCDVRCWYILLPFGQFSGHLTYLTTIRDIHIPLFWYAVKDKYGNPDSIVKLSTFSVFQAKKMYIHIS